MAGLLALIQEMFPKHVISVHKEKNDRLVSGRQGGVAGGGGGQLSHHPPLPPAA